MNLLKSILLFFFCSTISFYASSQIIQKTGYIYSELNGIISGMPGSIGDQYTEPTLPQLSTWENTLQQLLLGNYLTASDSANAIGYNLINFTDTFDTPNVTYYVLQTTDSNYWGTYVYNPNFCRPLVIQSPHSKKDANTGLQGIHVFQKTKALFYQVNGTHRCNSTVQSSCTGTTTSCSTTSQPYPVSDLAHVTQSLFQKTTQVLLNTFSNTYFFQFHGFAKGSTDPYVILSNGTTITPSPDYISSFKNNLFAEDSLLTFKIAHIDLTWTRLRGFWNTQARLINGSSTPCTVTSTATNGRFVHVEQERVRLRSNVSAWNKTVNALNNTFVCSAVGIEQSDSHIQQLKVYPNPVKDVVTVEWKVNFKTTDNIQLFNTLGQNMNHLTSKSRNGNKLLLNLSELETGLYFIRFNNQVVKVFKE